MVSMPPLAVTRASTAQCYTVIRRCHLDLPGASRRDREPSSLPSARALWFLGVSAPSGVALVKTASFFFF